MNDLQLSRSLRLSAWPCWQRATADDLPALRWTAENILQPTVDRWGPLYLTSWRYWRSSGCIDARTGDHADAGTVDFVPASASVEDVWRWMGANLKGRYGSLIEERDHIHVTRPGVGVEPGRFEFLREPVEGVYRAEVPGASTLAKAAAVAAAVYVLTTLSRGG